MGKFRISTIFFFSLFTFSSGVSQPRPQETNFQSNPNNDNGNLPANPGQQQQPAFGTKPQRFQPMDVNHIKSCYFCYIRGSNDCVDNRLINCSSGYSCYKYIGTMNGERFIDKGCLAHDSASGCYRIRKSDTDGFLGTRCFCDDENFCNTTSDSVKIIYNFTVLFLCFSFLLLRFVK